MQLSKLILGTAQMGLDYGINNHSGKILSKDTFSILDYAYDNGVRFIDTADSYGKVHSLLNSYQKITKKKFNIITKSYLEKNKGTAHQSEFINFDYFFNLENLFAFMFHSYDSLVKNKVILNLLEQKKSKDLIKNIGVSIYTNEEFEKVINIDQIDIIQIPFNILDNYSLRGRLIEKAKQKNKIIHIRSVFLQGALFMAEDRLPKKLKGLEQYLKLVNEIAHENNLEIFELALSYVFSFEAIDGIIIGVDSLTQLKKNISVVKSKNSNNLLKSINEIVVKESFLLNPSNWNN